MKITKIGHGTASDNEHVVFCVVDHNKVVVSSAYFDKQEYGMYWFEDWVQQQINRNADTITWFDLDWLDTMKGFSSITRIEKPVSEYKHKRYAGFEACKMKPFKRTTAKPQRNDPCSCGSGKKYKKCCS